jgi:hypothetical protein
MKQRHATAISTVVILLGVAVGSCGRQPAQTSAGAPTTTALRVVESDTRLIEQGQFYILSFNLDRPTTITVSVVLKSGPPIDSYLVGEQGLNTWQAMAANHQSIGFPYFADLSMAPLAGDYTRSAQLPAGRYALIIDNSILGATAPPFHLFKQSPALVAYTISAGD